MAEWHLDAEMAATLRDFIGDEDPMEIVFSLGFSKDDDGVVEYGLRVHSIDYPEEGCVMLCGEPATPSAESAPSQSLIDTKDMLLKQAAHVKDNANKLKTFEGAQDEARCRELAACYLEELAHSVDFSRQLSELIAREATGGKP